jgi:hypothetical protein
MVGVQGNFQSAYGIMRLLFVRDPIFPSVSSAAGSNDGSDHFAGFSNMAGMDMEVQVCALLCLCLCLG